MSNFMPHIHCYLGKPLLVWSMFTTDLFIGAAYVVISFTLWGLVKKIRIAFNAVVFCFGIFILACGMTHFMEVWTLWNPTYWISAGVKFITAIASVSTGIYLYRLRGQIIQVAEAAKLAEQRRLDLEVLTQELEQRVKERTQALQESQERFQEIFEKTAIGLAQVDVTGRWKKVNARLCEITGYTEDELLSMTFPEITHPDDIEVNWNLANRVLKNELKEYSLEKRYIHKFGKVIWAKIKVVLSRNQAGEPQHFVVSIDDISATKLAQESLQLERDKFEAVIRNADIGIGLISADGSVITLNPACLKIHGFESESELPGEFKNYTDIFQMHTFDDKLLEVDQWPLPRALRGEYVSKLEVKLTRRNSSEAKYVSYSVVPIFGQTGQPILFIFNIWDLTEQKKIQIQLEEALRARDEFLSIASHELKTPLSTLKIQAQLIKRGIEKGNPKVTTLDRVTRFADQTDKQVNRLGRLIDDMLDVSRIRTGRLAIQPEVADLGDLVQETVNRMRPQMLQEKTPVILEECNSIKGYWDRFRLEQVLINLLTNAVRYGNKMPVQVRLEKKDGNALLVVRDQGIGVAEENIDRIFNRFERAVSANEISGLGLGLFISKEIVKTHGGRVWVESDGEGKGASFFVELPIRVNLDESLAG